MKIANNNQNEQLKDITPGVHYDIGLENAIIGACLLESDAFARVRQVLDGQVFFSVKNKIIWDSMSELWRAGYPIDLVIVVQKIFGSGSQSHFDHVAFELSQKTNAVVSTANLEFHALLCRQLYAKRRLLELQMDAGSGIIDPINKMIEIQDEIKRIMDINTSDDWMDMSKIMMKLSYRMDSVAGIEQTGIQMGFPSMDAVCGGMDGGS